jgi:hypothetical protein
MGLNDLLMGRKLNLGKNTKIYCDDKEVLVADTVENIIVLNINSWAGGVSNLWNCTETLKTD